jgi:hypothetical protein
LFQKEKVVNSPQQGLSSIGQSVLMHLQNQPTESPNTRQFQLGQAIARMYIAAQNTSMDASDAACQAMENATAACRMGFDLIMRQSPYNVTARGNQN